RHNASSCAYASSAALLPMSAPAEPGSMLSALQKRLLVWRGCRRAPALAASPVTIVPRSMRAKPGSLPGTAASLAAVKPASLISIASAAIARYASNVDGERHGRVRCQLFGRNELVVLDVRPLRGRRRGGAILLLPRCGRRRGGRRRARGG